MEKLLENSLNNYISVYNMLEDDESKDIYIKRLSYLISGDFKYIDDIVTTYFPGYGGSRISLLRKALKGIKTVLYGAGVDGEKFIRNYMRDDNIVGFCDRDKLKQEDGYMGYPVISPDELMTRKDYNIMICSWKFESGIKKNLLRAGYPEEQIFSMYSFNITDPNQYFNPDFMIYENDEVFIDDGCFDLGSALRFKGHCKSVKKIYAFEPSPACFENCVKNREKYKLNEVQILPYATWSKRTTLNFNAAEHSGSSVTADRTGPGAKVTAVPIDEVIDPTDKVTFIKMDIEGSELESLKGAEKVIRKDKPKLAVCMYHKPEDMVELPLIIKDFVPEYKLFIRHHSVYEGETVLYAVMPDKLRR